ncbi:hypothetical protein [Cellulomonas sp. P5_E12]
MSTSDPNRPGGPDEAPAADESADTIEPTTPASDDSPAHQVAPGVETLDPPTATEADADGEPSPPTSTKADAPVEPVEPSPATGAVPLATTAEPALDTGRHAVVRPAPTPPDEPVAEPVVAETPALAPTTTTTPTAPVEPEPVVPVAAPATSAPTEPPVAPPTTAEDDRLFPDPNAPRSTSVGSHILGVLVGLILGPVGVGVLLLGQSRILAAQVDGWDASTEVLGIVLVSLGLLLLACVLLLALWTPAVPITAGTILTLAGIVYLYAPSVAREQTLNVLTSSGWRLTVTQVTVAGTSGTVLAVGFLLLLAGLVAASARRRGVRFGEFRERHRA